MTRYRQNVALILTRGDGRVLVCERSDFRGSWQFPQGGVKNGEDLENALAREVREEIGLSSESYALIDSKGPYRYLFRPGFHKEGCEGQEQTYFVARVAPGAEDRISVDHEEFRSCRWVLPEEFQLDWIPPIKRDVYRAVLLEFFGVEIQPSPGDRQKCD